jgi:Ankyrin repeats (3 copies)
MQKTSFLFVCISFVMSVVGITEQEKFFKVVKEGDLATIKNLVGKVNVNEQDAFGKTALWIAVFRNDLNMVKFLLDNGAEPNISRLFATTPVEEAIKNRYLDILKLFVTHENINKELPDGYNPLMLAVVYNKPDIVEFLLKQGANPTAFTAYKLTALSEAIRTKNLDILKLFVTPENINKEISRNGVTSLMLAALEGLSEIVEFLLEKGANPLLTNLVGKTARDFAKNEFAAEGTAKEDKNKYKKIMDLLEAKEEEIKKIPKTTPSVDQSLLIPALQKLTQTLQALQIKIEGK